jgi:CRISPR-associated protein Cas1
VWTVDADIKNYFDTIWHRALASDLAVWIDDERILRLLLRWMRTFGWRGRGIAQGSPISPMFANIYLHPFDRLMAVSGWHVVRFADDFVVLTAGELNARRALKDAERLLRGRGLALNAEKTRIVPPDQIFTFLGATLSAKSVTKPLAPGGVPTADQS